MKKKHKENSNISLNQLNFENLEEFGLSPYEAKVYYTMLQLGLVSARDISNESGIPFGRIYDVLASLESKNLINIQESYPKKYVVVNPKNSIKILLKKKEDELAQLSKKADVVEAQLRKIYANKSSSEAFWSIAIEKNAINRHLNKIEETEHELLLCETIQPGDTEIESDNLIYQLRELLGREVTIKFLCNTDSIRDSLQAILKKYPELSVVQVRFNSKIIHTFDIIDAEKVILKMTNPLLPVDYFAAIYIWEKEFATKLREKYLQLWNTGTTLI